MSLKFFQTHEELNSALEATKNVPEFLYAHHSILAKLNSYFPDARFHIGLYENNKNEELWVVFRECSTGKQYLHVMSEISVEFNTEEVYYVLEKCSKLIPGVFKNGQEPLFASRLVYLKAFQKWIDGYYKKDLAHHFFPTHYFYMTQTQKESVSKQDIELPDKENYHFADVDLQNDPKIITSLTLSMTKDSHYDLNHVSQMLRRMPHSIVKYHDEIVALFLQDPAGGFRSQFVQPEHRGKGLGNAIERDLAQKCIEFGYTPWKLVDIDNKSVLDASMRSPYWTYLKNGEKPVEFVIARVV